MMKNQLCIAALTSFAVLPMCIFVHEMGHLMVARSYHWKTQTYPAEVMYIEGNAADHQKLCFLLGGPMIENEANRVK